MNISTNNSIKKISETGTESSNTKTTTEDGKSFEDFLIDNNINLSFNDTQLLNNLLSIYEMPFNYSDALGMIQNVQNIKSSFNFDTMSISMDDALFFASTFDKYTFSATRSIISFLLSLFICLSFVRIKLIITWILTTFYVFLTLF